MSTIPHAPPQPQSPNDTNVSLRQQVDNTAAAYMDNVGRHNRRILPDEKDSSDRMKEKQFSEI